MSQLPNPPFVPVWVDTWASAFDHYSQGFIGFSPPIFAPGAPLNGQLSHIPSCRSLQSKSQMFSGGKQGNSFAASFFLCFMGRGRRNAPLCLNWIDLWKVGEGLVPAFEGMDFMRVSAGLQPTQTDVQVFWTSNSPSVSPTPKIRRALIARYCVMTQVP